MSSSDSSALDSATVQQPAAPYAQPSRSHDAPAFAVSAGRVPVGPYIPVPFRGKPTAEGATSVSRVPTPAMSRPVTPLYATPAHATPLHSTPVLPLTAGEEPRPSPPSYPTPSYFTPVYSEPQSLTSDTLAVNPQIVSLFELPAVMEPSAAPDDAVLASAPPLPWIDAFLSSTPALPMQSINDPTEAVTGFAQEFVLPEATAWPTTEVAPDAPVPSDAWALDEAAEQMRALADEIESHEGALHGDQSAQQLFDGVSSLEPLPEWGDDDLIDIMPMATANRDLAGNERDSIPTPASAAHVEPWADRARRKDDDGSEAAARALEVLARRVRDGEISLAGYEPRLGDAAALAAALAALLGVRR